MLPILNSHHYIMFASFLSQMLYKVKIDNISMAIYYSSNKIEAMTPTPALCYPCIPILKGNLLFIKIQ